LRAIDASTPRVLWNSEQKSDGGDRPGNVAKFTPVTVANGKVYVPTFSNALVVYGLKP
jgi:outer membrane protein assembly factor BamB